MDLTRALELRDLVASWLETLKSPLLAAIRWYWGFMFFFTGFGKLADLDKTAAFFTSVGIPMPEVNAVLAGGVEALCGLLLLFGLGSRLAAIPLIVIMVMAYATADSYALASTELFVTATPFRYLLAAVLVLVLGPGVYSVDHGLMHWWRSRTSAQGA